jgi:uncharacterized protein (TIGR03435 family)
MLVSRGVVLSSLAFSIPIPAQPQAAPAPLEFEVASVRPSGPHVPGRIETVFLGGPGTPDPERITATRITLLSILQVAYDVKADQISGPGWLAQECFDIVAKAPPGATREQTNAMLRSLLADRFKLMLHREKRDFPAWDLVVAKGGSKLKETAYPDAKQPGPGEGVPAMALPLDQDGFPKFPPGQRGGAGRNVNGVTHAAYQSLPISDLIAALSISLATRDGSFSTARIVDKTGLTGKYDFHLEYSVDNSGHPAGALDALPTNADALSVGGGGPTIFTALEKQLGLKLERTKTLLDVLVIDHAEKAPTEN